MASNFDPLSAYSAGLIGARSDPRADEEFGDYIIRAGGNPAGGEVAQEWEFADLGKGKLTLLFPKVMEVFPDCFPNAAQVIGDCFVSGTMVRMGDGSEKPIEGVAVGDSVLTHAGRFRSVTRLIRKRYSGDVLTISAKGAPRSVTCTPDHEFVAGGEGSQFWCRADLLSEGTRLLLPRTPDVGRATRFDLQDHPLALIPGQEGRNVPITSASKCRWLYMKHEVNRYVDLDFRLGWLIGLYLAEGSLDRSYKGHASRITLNLSAKEGYLAETAAMFFEEIFGVKPRVGQVPSKPSVLYVRVVSAPVAELFARLAPGNTYTKRVSLEVFSTPRATRLGILRGWFAGDGHFKAEKSKSRGSQREHLAATGVSVSGGLIQDFFDIANSCGVVSSVGRRKARKKSRAASTLCLYGENAYTAFPGEYGSHPAAERPRAEKPGAVGVWKKVSGVSRSAFDGFVYCLEVEEDHSFVANGFAVHNCVGAAAANCLVTSMGMEIASGKPDEVTGEIEAPPDIPPLGVTQGVVARESLFCWRGYDEDGWVCSEAAKTACEKGFLVRKPYPDLGVDLTRYTTETVRIGGRRPPGEQWLAESKQHRARTATFLDTRSQVRDFLAQGYGVFNCSALGFATKRDENGVAKQAGKWAHAQSWIGYDDRPETHRLYGQALVLWLNQWGPGWIGGPRRIHGTDIDIPEGSYWALADTIDRCGSRIALSSVAGWPRRKHTSYGATGNI